MAEFDYAVWNAEIEEDKLKVVHKLLEAYRNKFGVHPNAIFVHHNMFDNLPRAAMLFGMKVIPVECLAECRDPPYAEAIGGEMVVAIGRLRYDTMVSKEVQWPPFYTLEELRKIQEKRDKASFESEYSGTPVVERCGSCNSVLQRKAYDKQIVFCPACGLTRIERDSRAED